MKVQENAGTSDIEWHDHFFSTGHTAAIRYLEENFLLCGSACVVRTKSIK